MTHHIVGRPERTEVASYYHRYIDRIQDPDILTVLGKQIDSTVAFAKGFSEQRSLHRYAPDKWSIRQLMGHVNDTERVFVFRALWFARGFDTPLPSYDENVGASAAGSDDVPWDRHIEEFRVTRQSTLAFFSNLQPDAWARTGIASDNTFSVRGLAYIVAGHLAHHLAVVSERYM